MISVIASLENAQINLAVTFWRKVNRLLAEHGDDLAQAWCFDSAAHVQNFCRVVAARADPARHTPIHEALNVEISPRAVTGRVTVVGVKRASVVTIRLERSDIEDPAAMSRHVNSVIAHWRLLMRSRAHRLCKERRDMLATIESLPEPYRAIAKGKKQRQVKSDG